MALAGTTGYGYTEPPEGYAESHSTVYGQGSVALTPLRWVDVAMRFDGRFDKHPAEDNVTEQSGVVGDPRLTVRGGYSFEDQFNLGASFELWMPGAQAPSLDTSATTASGQAVFAWLPFKLPLTLAVNVGYRLDNSAEASPPASDISTAMRLALARSDFNAVLGGLAVGYRMADTEAFVEGTYEYLHGRFAPDPVESPIRAALGLRQHLPQSLQVELLAVARVSERPDSSLGAPYVPVEPRFAAFAGLRYRFELTKPPKAAPGPRWTQRVAPEAPKVDVAPAPEPELPPQVATVDGLVLDDEGNPVFAAHVLFKIKDVERRINVGSDGEFKLEDLPVGEATVHVSADGFHDEELKVNLGAGASVPVKITLEALPPAGQIRGLVRAFSGEPIDGAVVSVRALDTKVITDPEGYFEIDVLPGFYDVTIEAYGYQEQRRTVKVPKDGVTVLNADMKEDPDVPRDTDLLEESP